MLVLVLNKNLSIDGCYLWDLIEILCCGRNADFLEHFSIPHGGSVVDDDKEPNDSNYEDAKE